MEKPLPLSTMSAATRGRSFWSLSLPPLLPLSLLPTRGGGGANATPRLPCRPLGVSDGLVSTDLAVDRLHQPLLPLLLSLHLLLWNLSLKNRDTAEISTVFCAVVHSEHQCSTNNWNVHHFDDELGERHGDPPFSAPPPPPLLSRPPLLPLAHSPPRQPQSGKYESSSCSWLKLPGEAQPMSVRRCT